MVMEGDVAIADSMADMAEAAAAAAIEPPFSPSEDLAAVIARTAFPETSFSMASMSSFSASMTMPKRVSFSPVIGEVEPKGESDGPVVLRPSVARATSPLSSTSTSSSILKSSISESKECSIYELEKKTKLFSEILKKGSTMLKVDRKGRARKRFFWLSEDGTELLWRQMHAIPLGFDPRGGVRKILLADVTHVLIGPRTDRFANFDWEKDKPWLCFSLVTSERTVDFKASSWEELVKWFLGFQLLVPMSCSHLSKGELYWQKIYLRTVQMAEKKLCKVDEFWHQLVRETREQMAALKPADK